VQPRLAIGVSQRERPAPHLGDVRFRVENVSASANRQLNRPASSAPTVVLAAAGHPSHHEDHQCNDTRRRGVIIA